MRLLDSKVLGQMVRYHRKQSGLTQEALGRMAGLGKTVVFDIEKGKLNVKLNTLLKLFEVLNIQIDFQSPLMKYFEEELNEES
ncbi:MAG: helix-turn-helix domain-containing protein [Rhabdochlamydiaceae bacterium]|jgi:y4mF family transcriptional regulator